MLLPGATIENATDEAHLDRYSGRVIGRRTYAQRPSGHRIRELFKPVHTGTIFGRYTKLLALVIRLMGANFPITGIIMWRNRWYKSRRHEQRRTVIMQ
jgi:uncharacterized iron-regulated membrane protein